MARQPQTTSTILRARAELLHSLRMFFAGREVMEVETPVLASTTVTDPHIESLLVTNPVNPTIGYLQTSPEYAMKRLLCSGSGPIFQICKAFRGDEAGRLHRSEFTLLEWYRPGFSLDELMDEVTELLQEVLKLMTVDRISYYQLFQDYLGIDPHRIELNALREFTCSRIDITGSKLDRTDYLQLLLAHEIEPRMPAALFVYDFPVEQAALARVERDDNDYQVACRFELFVGGMELANGYQELIDAVEQRARFERDIERRQDLGRPLYPIDEDLLAALDCGMPECAGVALGLDRLLMLKTGADSIEEVMSLI